MEKGSRPQYETLHWAGSGGHRLHTLLDWIELWQMGTDAQGKVVVLHTQKTEIEKAMTFRFGSDATLKNQNHGHTPCWNCRCKWSTACARGAWRSCALDLFFETLGVRAVVTSKQSSHLLLQLPSKSTPHRAHLSCATHAIFCVHVAQDVRGIQLNAVCVFLKKSFHLIHVSLHLAWPTVLHTLLYIFSYTCTWFVCLFLVVIPVDESIHCSDRYALADWLNNCLSRVTSSSLIEVCSEHTPIVRTKHKHNVLTKSDIIFQEDLMRESAEADVIFEVL